MKMKKISILLFSVLVSIFLSNCNKKLTIDADITTNTTWTSNEIVTIGKSIYVSNGATLTIEPGTTIKFESGAGLYVEDGTLLAEGTSDKPITFTSLAKTPAKGAWNGLSFSSQTLNNTSLKYCIIEYAGQQANSGAVYMAGCRIKMDYCKINNAKYNGIYMIDDAKFVSFTNNEIKEVDNHAIVMDAKAIPTIGENNTLTTSGDYGVRINGGNFGSRTFTWRKLTCPYIINSGIYIDENANVTIQPGTVIKFAAASWISVGYSTNGTLTAEGTSSEPITFTSSATSPASGAWEGLLFYSFSTNSSLKYCNISYAGGTSYKASVYIYGSKITMENCNVTNSANYGVKCLDPNSGFISFTNNNFSNIEDHVVRIQAEQVHTLGTGNTFNASTDKGIEIYAGEYNSTTNKTWLKHNVPYYVTASIDFVGSITFEAGSVYKCGAGVWLSFGWSSNINATIVGTSTNRIVFTSSASSPAAGSWGGLYFYYHTTSNTNLNYVDIKYAGYNEYGSVLVSSNVALHASNVDIQYSESCGFYLYNGATLVGSGNTFSNNGGDGVCNE